MFNIFRRSALSGYKQSRMSPFDEYALNKLLDGKNGLSILEIGSWLGAGSTQILAKHAKRLVCVDHWKGNDNSAHQKIAKQVDPQTIFLENTRQFSDNIVAIRSSSSAIGELLADNKFDFIFIDGDHRYHQTIEDIDNCLSKVKPGGIIAGHDCEGRLEDMEHPFSPSDLEKDHMDSPIKKFLQCHPGVISAVHERFGSDVNLFADDINKISLQDGNTGHSTIWYKQF